MTVDQLMEKLSHFDGNTIVAITYDSIWEDVGDAYYVCVTEQDGSITEKVIIGP